MGRSRVLPAAVLGFGMGGFLDGIILHQLLQWHHFVSNLYPTDTVPGLEINTLWDGIFHSATYVITVIGLILLWRAIQRPGSQQSPRVIWGGLLVGMGVFHLFDSIVNHWLLRIHHIRPGPDALAYDLAFFGLGILFAVAGLSLLRTRRITSNG
jgi:uncharacterized membrane protein